MIIILLVLPLQYMTIQTVYSQIDNTSSSNITHIITPPSIIKPKVDLKIEGTIVDDKIKGGDGDDKLNGKEGDDRLTGGRGDDELDGDEGNDIIKGQQGNDEINGGEGSDIMVGGLGSDTFNCDEFDKIMDFSSVEGDKKIGSCLVIDYNKANTTQLTRNTTIQ